MLRITQLKLPVEHTREQLEKKLIRMAKIRETDLLSYTIAKRSLDARKKPELYYVYTIEAEVAGEQKLKRRLKAAYASFHPPVLPYRYEPQGTAPLKTRPVVVGTGPAGLFCGYALARMGYRPILVERGAPVEERIQDVEEFWQNGTLKPDSNVQFGEGGAGTFSDGKLNTLTHDPGGRGREVLRLFAEHGAPEDILYDSRPHIGTDRLIQVVRALRESILRLGGEVRFHTRVTDLLETEEESGVKRLRALVLEDTRTGESGLLETETAVLALGHSARDTFAMLHKRGLTMEPKAFAVGVRVEHAQAMIDENQYGRERGTLPAAAYKLTANLENQRGVYTFCMCPGGYVVNASSEPGRCAVNGMSYRDRDGANANSAVIVTVRPEDYPGEGPLSGIAFQRILEEAACREGKGQIPVQRFADFCADRPSEGPGALIPQIKGGYTWANVRRIFPEKLAVSLEEGIRSFDRRIQGFGGDDALLSGVESRTSSPVRILRDGRFLSSLEGVYPCGEGAGYAGGITSAAIDGLKVAEAVSQTFRPFDKREQV